MTRKDIDLGNGKIQTIISFTKEETDAAKEKKLSKNSSNAEVSNN